MPSEKLIDVKLRLSEGERQAIEELRGDRGLNVCLRRAVQHWCIRERALQESLTLGLYADGLPPVQAPTPIRSMQEAPVTQIGRANHGSPEASSVEDDKIDKVEEVEEQEPSRRRPPTSAETWGAGPDHAS